MAAAEPNVSVIVNCHNAGPYLAAALDSVYAQTVGAWEIVLYDNASTDATVAIAQRYDHRLRYFYSPEFQSLGAARNAALAQARGHFLAFLDADDLWEPTKLERLLPLFDDPQVGLAYSNATFFAPSGAQSRQFDRSDDLPQGWCFDRLFASYCLVMSAVAIRRAAWEGLRYGFDPRFSIIEEMDVFLRIAHDWQVAATPESLAWLRQHPGRLSQTSGERVCDEKEALLATYTARMPDFSNRYADRAETMRRQIRDRRILQRWRAGDRRGMRAASRAGWPEPKYVAAYGLGFLPFGPVYGVYDRLKWLARGRWDLVFGPRVQK